MTFITFGTSLLRAKYKFKARKRVFEKAMAPPSQSQSMDTTDGPGPSSQSQASASGSSSGRGGGGSKVEAPLKGFTVFVLGKLSKPKAALTRQIEDLGGRVVKSVNQDVTICLSNKSKSQCHGKQGPFAPLPSPPPPPPPPPPQ